MGGGKKRESVNKSSAEQNADTTKRIVHSNGNDSDYGVFSDPDEVSDDKQPQSPTSPSSPTSAQSHIVELSPTEAIIEETTQPTDVVIKEDGDNADKVSPVATESIIVVLDKSLDTLKMKLEKDAVYSNKTTLTSFFSYVILAMEIDIAFSPSITAAEPTTTASTAAPDTAAYDSSNAERLIEYIIRNHSSTPEVEQFTLTMLQLGIVTHIINGVLEFNRTARVSTKSTNQSHTLQTLQSLEQLNLNHKKSGHAAADSAIDAADAADAAMTPKQPNCFVRFWRNLSCCCKCRKSRKDSILENTSHDSDESHKSDEDATMTVKQSSTTKNEEVSSLKRSDADEEMKELTI